MTQPVKIKRNEEREKTLVLATHESGVPYLFHPPFDEAGGVRHAFATRLGGVSTGGYASMNLSFTRGDKEEDVQENYRRMLRVIDRTPEDVVSTYQTHTVNIRRVTDEDCGKGVVRERDYRDVDGLVTASGKAVLAVYYADCLPVLFADKAARVIGAAHAGWRGSVGGIVTEMISRMEEMGASKKEIRVLIGPSICGACYEVGEEVLEEARKALRRAGLSGEDPLIFRADGERRSIDLAKLNLALLAASGIPKEHITLPDICTRCNPELLFSHRVLGEARGNMAAFLCLA